VTKAGANEAGAAAGRPILRVEGLVKHFPVSSGVVMQKRIGAVKAVDDISFSISPGETVALVGESGCGKSTTGRLVLRLLEPTAGTVEVDGEDIFKLDKAALRAMRRRMQIIFQDPYASLNPRMAVGDILAEPLKVHGVASGRALADRVGALLAEVGLSPYHALRYPHEFSGGQRQRIGIARALAVNPKLIVCDEPVSALDVSIQAQVINLLQDLQRRFGLSYLFIAHDLAVVKHIADRVAVMYLGKIVELADKSTLFANPRHPYTQALFSSIPIPDPTVPRGTGIIQGDVPSPLNPPSGCRFHTRCPHAEERCRVEEPTFREIAPGHRAACHFVERIAVPDTVRARQHSALPEAYRRRLAAYEARQDARRQAREAAPVTAPESAA